MPARYVINRDGVTAYAEVNPDYTRRPDPSDVFSVLDVLLAVRPYSYVRTAQVRTTTDCGIARDGGEATHGPKQCRLDALKAPPSSTDIVSFFRSKEPMLPRGPRL